MKNVLCEKINKYSPTFGSAVNVARLHVPSMQFIIRAKFFPINLDAINIVPFLVDDNNATMKSHYAANFQCNLINFFSTYK